MDTELQHSEYLQAAGKVRNRIALYRLAASIRRSHLVAGLGVIALVGGLRGFAEWRSGEFLLSGVILLAWLVVAALISLARLPGPKDALLLLDRKGQWKDCFSSAWEFLHRSSQTDAQQLHLKRAEKMLAPAVGSFPGVLPIPSLKWVWIAPFAAILFALTPWFRTPPDSRDMKLTESMKNAAAMQAEELRRESDRLGNFESLSEDEKGQLEALKVDVSSIAEKLAGADGLTAGEILEALEERARAAERLAEKMGLMTDEWASAEMLAEMEQHPDTADLGMLIRDKAAHPAAEEALRLGGVLGDAGIKVETEERMTRSLSDIMRAAVDEDLVRPVGERIGNASTKMSSAQPKTAAREFEELAKHFRDLAGREEARSKLEQLADSLRDAGLEISGSELEKMERLAEASGSGMPTPEGLQAINSQSQGADPGGAGSQQRSSDQEQSPNPSLPPGMPQGQEGGQQANLPGAAPGKGEKGGSENRGEEAFSAPVPGETPSDGQSGSGLGMSEKSREGSGEGGILSAPVPGMEPGQSTPGGGMSLADGSSANSAQGGDQAGTGTAELVASEASLIKAAGDAEVIAQAGRAGDSTFRSIEGGVRGGENAARTKQEIITDFLAAEEQALDEQSLPLSRRGHVLRYFSEIRKQFEDTGNE